MKKEQIYNKLKLLVFYMVSLLPLWLPWFGFDREIDGLRSGIEMINHIVLLILVLLMIITILCVPVIWQRKIMILVLLIHLIVYLGYFLFWYVPLITDFNIVTSFETAHWGFYVGILLNVVLIHYCKKH